MKVIDLINDLFVNKKSTEKESSQILSKQNGSINFTTVTDDIIYGEELRQFKDKLMECDEFKDCEMLEFLPTPIVQNKEGKPIVATSVLLGEGMKFKGRCFLLSLTLTPTMYDPKTMYEPVKDGVTLTPVMYNYKDFTPYRKIILPWCVEGQDSDIPLRRAELFDLIDKVLKNPKDYETKGIRRVLARGIFEKITTEESETGSKENLDIDVSEPPRYSQIFYIHYENVEGTNEVQMEIRNKIMHNSLKEKFMKRFEGKSLILEDELNKFLEENGATNGNQEK